MPPRRIVTLWNPNRVRMWLNRLPFFTRLVVLAIVACSTLGLFLPWLAQWGALIPGKVYLTSMHRLSTYPFFHRNFFGALLNLAILVPLLERFEAEHGTLVSAALFVGPFSTIPAAVYAIIEYLTILGGRYNEAFGVSAWIFLLVSAEGIKTFKSHPYFQLSTLKLPTYLYPLALLLLLNILLPQPLSRALTSPLLLHLLSSGTGYAFALGYLPFLIPPERGLRFVETRLGLLGRLPHYVSLEGTVWGRYGVVPSALEEGRAGRDASRGRSPGAAAAAAGVGAGGHAAAGAEVARTWFVASTAAAGRTSSPAKPGAPAPFGSAAGGVAGAAGGLPAAPAAAAGAGPAAGANTAAATAQAAAGAPATRTGPQAAVSPTAATGAAASASAVRTGEKVA